MKSSLPVITIFTALLSFTSALPLVLVRGTTITDTIPLPIPTSSWDGCETTSKITPESLPASSLTSSSYPTTVTIIISTAYPSFPDSVSIVTQAPSTTYRPLSTPSSSSDGCETTSRISTEMLPAPSPITSDVVYGSVTVITETIPPSSALSPTSSNTRNGESLPWIPGTRNEPSVVAVPWLSLSEPVPTGVFYGPPFPDTSDTATSASVIASRSPAILKRDCGALCEDVVVAEVEKHVAEEASQMEGRVGGGDGMNGTEPTAKANRVVQEAERVALELFEEAQMEGGASSSNSTEMEEAERVAMELFEEAEMEGVVTGDSTEKDDDASSSSSVVADATVDAKPAVVEDVRVQPSDPVCHGIATAIVGISKEVNEQELERRGGGGRTDPDPSPECGTWGPSRGRERIGVVANAGGGESKGGRTGVWRLMGS